MWLRCIPYSRKSKEMISMRKSIPPIPIVIFLLGLAIAYAGVTYYSTVGYVRADIIQIDGNMIVIGKGCTAIVADTSPERAYAIQLGLEKRIEGRPLTHDTFVETLKSFNITLQAVQMQRYDGTYYYSDMIMTDGEKVLRLDAMPSDAIAIALRADAPIYINETLLEEVGEKICE